MQGVCGGLTLLVYPARKRCQYACSLEKVDRGATGSRTGELFNSLIPIFVVIGVVVARVLALTDYH